MFLCNKYKLSSPELKTAEVGQTQTMKDSKHLQIVPPPTAQLHSSLQKSSQDVSEDVSKKTVRDRKYAEPPEDEEWQTDGC